MLYTRSALGTPKYMLYEATKRRKHRFHFFLASYSITKAKLNDKTERFKIKKETLMKSQRVLGKTTGMREVAGPHP